MIPYCNHLSFDFFNISIEFFKVSHSAPKTLIIEGAGVMGPPPSWLVFGQRKSADSFPLCPDRCILLAASLATGDYWATN